MMGAAKHSAPTPEELRGAIRDVVQGGTRKECRADRTHPDAFCCAAGE